MMLKTIVLSMMCVWAVAQGVLAQDRAVAGLLDQLVTPAPATPASKPTPGELNARAVHAPATTETAVVPAAQTVKSPDPEVKAPPVKAPEVNVPVVSVPAVQQKPASPAVIAGTNNPTLKIAQPKKRNTGSSLLGRATSNTNAPQRETVITSEKMDFDNREGVILFDDNVYVDDPQFNMRSDRLLVFMDGTNDVSQVMAIGHVTFSNEMRSATCTKAVYTRKDGQIVMTGDVRLKSVGETAGEVRGEKVVIWVDDERVEVLQGATITLPPGTFKKASEHEKKASDHEKKEPKGDKPPEGKPQPK